MRVTRSSRRCRGLGARRALLATWVALVAVGVIALPAHATEPVEVVALAASVDEVLNNIRKMPETSRRSFGAEARRLSPGGSIWQYTWRGSPAE